jgi:hypothetical protein
MSVYLQKHTTHGCIYQNLHRKRWSSCRQHVTGDRDAGHAIAGAPCAGKAIAGNPVAGYAGSNVGRSVGPACRKWLTLIDWRVCFFRDLMPLLIEEFGFSLHVNEMLSVMLIRDAYKMDDIRSVAIRTYHIEENHAVE